MWNPIKGIQEWLNSRPASGDLIRQSAKETVFIPVFDERGKQVPNQVQRVINDKNAVDDLFGGPDKPRVVTREIQRVHQIYDTTDAPTLCNQVIEDAVFISRKECQKIHRFYEGIEKIETAVTEQKKLRGPIGQTSKPAASDSGPKAEPHLIGQPA